jgi:disulfide bond formation protein DsbB
MTSRQLARRAGNVHMARMTAPNLRLMLLLTLGAAAAVLGSAIAAERIGGLVPCALCLLERMPYRGVIALAAVALVLPRRWARLALWLVVPVLLAGAAVGVVHIGVEQQWWPSPMPECMAPRFSGGSIAERLASMPAKPSKACEDPSYLIPGIPVSMAELNTLAALAFATCVTMFLLRTQRGTP